MDVQAEILTGRLKIANMVLQNNTALQNGALYVNWEPIFKGNRSVLAVENRYSLGDSSLATFQAAYACLSAFVGQYAGGSIDPNAQNPGVVIDVTTPAGTYNSARIPFSGTTTPAITDYNTTLKATYGSNPDVLIFVNVGGVITPDYTTSPVYDYIGGNPAGDITSITWTYPANVSGYIQIGGSPSS